jgi:hypothetical protein
MLGTVNQESPLHYCNVFWLPEPRWRSEKKEGWSYEKRVYQSPVLPVQVAPPSGMLFTKEVLGRADDLRHDFTLPLLVVSQPGASSSEAYQNRSSLNDYPGGHR